MLLPLGVFAQEMKIAVVDAQAIFSELPELSSVENEIMALNQQYEKELEGMREEYNKKYSDLTAAQDSLTENIKMMRLQEIQDIQTRMENLMRMAQQVISQKQEELLAPLYKKLNDAIEAVGEEKGYTYILTKNTQVVMYVGKSAIDATEAVKAKLGIK